MALGPKTKAYHDFHSTYLESRRSCSPWSSPSRHDLRTPEALLDCLSIESTAQVIHGRRVRRSQIAMASAHSNCTSIHLATAVGLHMLILILADMLVLLIYASSDEILSS
jgi:hypothetical protein